MNESWIKETTELIEDWELEKSALEMRIDEMQSELYDLNNKIEGAHALLEAYVSKHNLLALPIDDIRPGYFSDKSYPQMLAEIAGRSGGYFRVIDAVEIMLKAGVSDNRRAIQANIYSTLKRLKNTKYMKVKKGEYRYVNGVAKEQGSSGLRQAVKELKEQNPYLTKKEVLQVLIKNGFDFKGKKPGNAVNMAWVYLFSSKAINNKTH